MTHVEPSLAILLALVIAYPIIMRVASELAQPIRLRLATLGVETLSSDHLSTFEKHVVNSMLDDAYDPKVAVFFALAFPIFVVGSILGLISDAELDFSSTGEVRGKLREMSRMHTIAIAAANPLFSIVIIVEAVIIGALAFPYLLLHSVLRGSVKLGGMLEMNTFATVLSDKIMGNSQAC